MDNIIQYVDVNGKKYKLQHPGVRQYLKIKQKLYCTIPISGTNEFSLQINEESLFDYSFGKKPSDSNRIVYACNGKGRDWVDWSNESSQEKAEQHTPTLSELTEVWSVLLQRFLGMQSINDIEATGYTWLDKPPTQNELVEKSSLKKTD